MVEYLLSQSANVNEIDRFIRTPLHWCAVTNNTKVAELLIKNGANLGIKDAELRTPVQLAELNKNRDMVDYLKKIAYEQKM